MAALQPGQMLGQYQITSQIGKGGMATVYKAYQASMDRYVALKVVSGQVMDDPHFLKRFTQEARMIARLEHPHILPVHDFGETDGIPYMVMRFIEAGTLTEVLEAGQLPLPEIDRIFSQLTDALGYAHEQGIIHRDIKPSNAMLDKRGDVFLTDFGIAKMVEGSAGLTATGAITGTPSYMSPEQAQGNKVDQRSDIYSLGIVLFEMLTGRVPFEAETPMAVIFKQILDPPPPLSTVRPDLPYTLEIVLLRAMSKKPEDRYASMAAFQSAWKKALAEMDSPAAPAQPVAVTAPEPKQTPAMAGVAAMQPVAPPAVEPVKEAATAVKIEYTPAKNGPNWRVWMFGILAGLAICCLLPAFFIFSSFTIPVKLQIGPTETLRIIKTKTPLKPLVQASATLINGAEAFTASNSVFSIAFRNDEVLAAGFGGISIWNRAGDLQTKITSADGLPGGNVGAVFLDDDGSLWVGGDSGITHIHNNKFTTYNNEQGLDNNYVVAIARSGNRLLIGTQYAGRAGSGLLEYQAGKWQAVPGFPSQDPADGKSVSSNVRQIATDGQGNLWVATESGLAMQAPDKKWKIFKTAAGLPDNSVYTVFADVEGYLWAGTANGGAVKFDPAKQLFESFSDLKTMDINDVMAIVEEKDRTLWFVGGNVARYNPATNEWTRFTANDGSLPFYSASTAGINSDGTVYIGSSESGLARYVGKKFEKLFIANALHYGQYGHIVAAPDGKLNFVQLYESGVDQFDPIDKSWKKAPDDLKTPRAFDKKGQLWSSAGTDGGLWFFGTDKTVNLTAETDGLPANRVTAVAFNPDGTALVATEAGIALLENLEVKTIYNAANSGLASDGVYVLFVASDDSLWTITNGGFSRRLPDGTWEHFTSEGLFGNAGHNFYAIAEDSQGNIWLSSDGDGLYLFSKDKWSQILFSDPSVGLPSNNLTGLVVAPDGALWIGTNGQGVVRYDGNTWKTYGLEDGLIDLHVNGLYAEPSGAIWLTTNGGITRLEP